MCFWKLTVCAGGTPFFPRPLDKCINLRVAWQPFPPAPAHSSVLLLALLSCSPGYPAAKCSPPAEKLRQCPTCPAHQVLSLFHWRHPRSLSLWFAPAMCCLVMWVLVVCKAVARQIWNPLKAWKRWILFCGTFVWQVICSDQNREPQPCQIPSKIEQYQLW